MSLPIRHCYSWYHLLSPKTVILYAAINTTFTVHCDVCCTGIVFPDYFAGDRHAECGSADNGAADGSTAPRKQPGNDCPCRCRRYDNDASLHHNSSLHVLPVVDHQGMPSRIPINSSHLLDTIEQDLIATEMLAFPSKSSRNKNDS